MGFDGNLTTIGERNGLSNVRQDRNQLTCFERRRRPTTEIYGLQRTSSDAFLYGLQAYFSCERMEKCVGCAFPMEFEVERTEITALAAEWDMKVEADRAAHGVRVNGMGLEKSRSRTISISSVGGMPRLRMCDVQVGCCRSDSNTCLRTCGLMRDSHSRAQA